MEPNNTTPDQTTPAPTVTPEPNPTPVPASSVSSIGVTNSPKTSGDSGKKKQLIMVLLLVVILVVLGALGYYYYAFVMNKPAEEMSVVPTAAPQVTTVPEANDQIQSEEELDGVISELDNATDEASMSQEANSLQSDSNF